MTKRITIIGTGLIGTSLGLALKAAALDGIEVVGHDRDHGAATRAEKRGAFDRAERNLPRSVDGAGLVVIATPVLAVREVMQQIAPDLPEGAVVTDTASTKASVMRWADEVLPPGVSFIGAHPMAGKETPGADAAEATLFLGKPYCICPSVTATEASIKTLLGLVQVTGAIPIFIDPAEHDQYAAAVSHLPLMMSTGLFSMLRESPSWPDMAVMASSGFRDITRLASGDPVMSHDIWVTNREALIHWIERFEAQLQAFRALLQDARDDKLLEIFARVQFERENFVAQQPQRPYGTEVDTSEAGKAALMDMVIGGMLADRVRKIQKLPEMANEASAASDDPDAPPPPTRAEKMAEDIRRDIEKLERERAEKQAQADQAKDQ